VTPVKIHIYPFLRMDCERTCRLWKTPSISERSASTRSGYDLPTSSRDSVFLLGQR